MDLKALYLKTYANLSFSQRSEIIAVVDNENYLINMNNKIAKTDREVKRF